MSAAKELGKSQTNQLVETENQLLHLSEVRDEMGLLKSCMNSIFANADRINKLAGRLEKLMSMY